MKFIRHLLRTLFHKSTRSRYPSKKYPLSDSLCKFIDNHPEFEKAVKLGAPERFILFPLIITTSTPLSHKNSSDQVIGLWYYDKNKPYCKRHKKVCVFKQDFIINVSNKEKEFVAFSAKQPQPPYVKNIGDFFIEYGNDGKFYHDGNKQWNHHYATINDLPDEPHLRELARTIELEES